MKTFPASVTESLQAREAQDYPIWLVTITVPGSPSPTIYRVCDLETQRITATAEEIKYGTISRGLEFERAAVVVSSAGESATEARNFALTFHLPSPELLDAIISIPYRNHVGVLLERVMSSAPNVVILSVPGLTNANSSLNPDAVTIPLEFANYTSEPANSQVYSHTHFPGLP